jgi:hypothetical protein
VRLSDIIFGVLGWSAGSGVVVVMLFVDVLVVA